MSKNIIAASTSTIFGSDYLAYLVPELEILFKDVKEILFIPYARPSGISYDAYTALANKAFQKINKTVRGIHTYTNAKEALTEAKGIFTGGGNTFVLVNTLYNEDLMQLLRSKLLDGTPYLGTSAGSNICGLTMQNTNDMPIVYPPSFKTTGVIPFNINAHYFDPIKNSTHMGETRETRIKEYHCYNTVPVVGLREGSYLKVIDNAITLEGSHTARVFEQGKKPYEIESDTRIELL